MNPANTEIVVSLWDEDIQWTRLLHKCGFNVKIYERKERNPESEYQVAVNKGQEASSYLQYIVQHYDRLPEYVIFLHGHERSWHTHSESIVQTIFRERGKASFFTNLNKIKLGRITTNPWLPGLKAWFENYIEPYMGPLNRFGDWTLGHNGCAQFIVHKSLITSHPRKLYEELFSWIQETSLDNAITSRYMEWTWHLIWHQVPPVENLTEQLNTRVDLANNLRIVYGISEQECVDVTKEALSAFTCNASKTLLIPTHDSFNTFFGDPFPSQKKLIFVYVNGTMQVAIPEFPAWL